MPSGECIKACDYGVNPRFLLTMARRRHGAREGAAASGASRRRGSSARSREDVSVLSRLQLSESELASRSESVEAAATELPDVVFYTGCNVLKTPHIALLASTSWTDLHRYRVMGGPTPLLRRGPVRAGDIDTLRALR